MPETQTRERVDDSAQQLLKKLTKERDERIVNAHRNLTKLVEKYDTQIEALRKLQLHRDLKEPITDEEYRKLAREMCEKYRGADSINRSRPVCGNCVSFGSRHCGYSYILEPAHTDLIANLRL